jgi:fatty acid desaturase
MTKSRRQVFRYSRWDLALLAVIPVQVVFFYGFAYLFDELSWPLLLAGIPAWFAMSLMNTGASHNHYHTPIFRNVWLNRIATMGYSFNGGPKTPFNIGHGLHHRTPEPWNEQSLLELCGLRRPLHHQILAFAVHVVESFGVKYLVLLWLLRRWPIEKVARTAAPGNAQIAESLADALKDPGTLLSAKLDIAAWLLFRVGLCIVSLEFFVFYFIPVSYVVGTIRGADNYFQHWGATDPTDSTRDSVSCYGLLYNLLTFNLGYHQEHHYRPGVHWLKLRRTRAELPTDRRIVAGAHYLNMPIFHPRLAARLRADAARRAAERQPAP